MAGWSVNAKRVERIWRAEGLKMPARQPRRGRLWLADGSCIRLRPEHANHVCAYDFVSERTHDGCKLRLLTIVDEYTRECLAIRVARRITSHDVLMTLADLFFTLKEAQILVANWRRLYNGLRPHSSLGQRPPAPGTIAWPGFSLEDFGPPALTPEAALALS